MSDSGHLPEDSSMKSGSGDNGKKNIHWQHINAMMDKPKLKNRQTQDRYKKLLHQHGLIHGGWERVYPPRSLLQQVQTDRMG